MEKSGVIYSSETEDYSKEDILNEIDIWVDENKIYKDVDTMGILFDYVIGLVEWQSPYTVLCEIDDDEMEALNSIQSIGDERFNEIIDSYNEITFKYNHLGKYLIPSEEINIPIIAIDNTTGDAWTEEYMNTEKATMYLNDKEPHL